MEAVADDFRKSRPVLLFVDREPPSPALPGFDYLAYLKTDPGFARTLSDYDFLANTMWFRVYRRKDKAGTSPATKAASLPAPPPRSLADHSSRAPR